MAEAARAFSGFDKGWCLEVASDLILTRSHFAYASVIPLVGNLTWVVRDPGWRGLGYSIAKVFIYERSCPRSGEKRHGGAEKAQ
ncbi:hypothetical protein Pres01_53270 [Metapseudomonas resinovorans]|nr:hypothetical protein Pres01_53270 [Pseudomonas resinovorans]